MASSTSKHTWTRDPRLAKVKFEDGTAESAESEVTIKNEGYNPISEEEHVSIVNLKCSVGRLSVNQDDPMCQGQFGVDFVQNPQDASGKYSHSYTEKVGLIFKYRHSYKCISVVIKLFHLHG